MAQDLPLFAHCFPFAGDLSSPQYDAGVEALAKLTTLEKLNLMGLGPLRGKTISMLTKLTRLRALNLSILQLQDKHVLAVTRIGKPPGLCLALWIFAGPQKSPSSASSLRRRQQCRIPAHRTHLVCMFVTEDPCSESDTLSS